MKRIYSVLLAVVSAGLVVAAPVLAAPRVPQIAFANAMLQTRLNALGQSINTLTDQQDGLVWGSTVSSNSTMTIQFEFNGNPNQDEVGIVKLVPGTSLPAGTCTVFPASADSGWFAVASFRPGGQLIVSLFDQHATTQGQTSYSGVDRAHFAYYLKNASGTYFSHDGLNSADGNKAHALAYSATGPDVGSWWLCWEDAPISNYLAANYTSAIVFMESMNPTAVSKSTWGQLKQRFR